MHNLQIDQLPQALDMPGAGAVQFAEAIHVSRHRRGFPWPDGKGDASEIYVYHLWHECM